jgi:hypothetical protein
MQDTFVNRLDHFFDVGDCMMLNGSELTFELQAGYYYAGNEPSFQVN